MKKKNSKEKVSLLYTFLSMVRLVLICSVAACLLFTFVFRREKVVGTSMEPELKNGQQVLINVAASYLSPLKRFDVVVVKDDKTHSYWVKRIIGLPQETIEYKRDVLYVNKKKIKEPFLNKNYRNRMKKKHHVLNFTQDYHATKLGNDEYLLVGDNRMNSLDSRNSQVGPFKREQIIAKGVWIVSPMKEMRFVGNGNK